MLLSSSIFPLLHSKPGRSTRRTPLLNFHHRPNPSASQSRFNAARGRRGGKKAGEEVEIKLRLRDSAAHQKLLSVLFPTFHVTTHFQENLFFDGPNSELAAARAALRLRFYRGDEDRRCVLALKSQPTISSGVSRAEELEIDLDPELGWAWVAEPWKLGRSGPRPNWVLERVKEIAGEGGEGFGGWVCLGGFRNVRNVFDYQELRLEVDETVFDFGTNYEVECETENPPEAKRVIEELLMKNGVEFSYSQASKFAVFKSGKLPPPAG